MYILTHFLTSQPALIKLDNKNIGGHLTPLQRVRCDLIDTFKIMNSIYDVHSEIFFI